MTVTGDDCRDSESRSASRIRLRSMASHARAAPKASSPTIAAFTIVTVNSVGTRRKAGQAGPGGSNRRTGRVSMALIVKARRLIRQPASVS
jgi:hypothetical protein